MKILLALSLFWVSGAGAAPAVFLPMLKRPTVAAPAPPAVPSTPYEAKVQTWRAQFKAKDYAAARQSIEAAVTLAATPLDRGIALRNLWLTLDALGQSAPAMRAYQGALAQLADSPDELGTTRVLLAATYLNREMWPQAVDAWKQVMASADAEGATPSDKAPLGLALAEIYQKAKEDDQAHRQFEMVRAQLAPLLSGDAAPDDRASALILIGKSYFDESKLDAARQSFEAAAEVPGIPSGTLAGALKNGAALAQKQGRDADAKAGFDRARELLQTSAGAHFRAKEWEEAADDFSEALETGAPDAYEAMIAHWHLGLSLQGQGDGAGARAQYQTVIESAPIAANPGEASLIQIVRGGAYLELAQSQIAARDFALARQTLGHLSQATDVQKAFTQQGEVLLKTLPPLEALPPSKAVAPAP